MNQNYSSLYCFWVGYKDWLKERTAMTPSQALQEARPAASARSASLSTLGAVGAMMLLGAFCAITMPSLAAGLGASGLYFISAAAAVGVGWLVVRSGRQLGRRGHAFYVEMVERGQDLLAGDRIPAGA